MPPGQRWKCVCAYDGAGFRRLAEPGGRRPRIQDVIEARLAADARAARSASTAAAGRMRACMPAARSFISTPPGATGRPKLLAALRDGTAARDPDPVGPAGAARIFTPGFRPRARSTSTTSHLGDADPFTRPYCWPVFRPLDIAAMAAAAAAPAGPARFQGVFRRTRRRAEDTVRDLRRLEVARRGRRVRITAEADGFLYKMVRSLVGALVAVGEGRLTPAQLRAILARGGGRRRSRRAAPGAVPGAGDLCGEAGSGRLSGRGVGARSAAAALADLFFPPVCVHCGGLVEGSGLSAPLRRAAPRPSSLSAARLRDLRAPLPRGGGGRPCPHCAGLEPRFRSRLHGGPLPRSGPVAADRVEVPRGPPRPGDIGGDLPPVAPRSCACPGRGAGARAPASAEAARARIQPKRAAGARPWPAAGGGARARRAAAPDRGHPEPDRAWTARTGRRI